MSSTHKSLHGSDVREYTYTFSSMSTSSTGNAPDTDTEIELGYDTQYIVVQADSANVTNVSTDMTVNFYANLMQDGSGNDIWDTESWNSVIANMDDAQVITRLVSPGPKKLRLRVDNNDGSNVGNLLVKVRVLGSGL